VEITFSIKETTIDVIAIKKEDYMALSGKKIVASSKDMYHTLDKLLTSMIDDMTSIVTIIYGEGAEAKRLDKLVKKFEDKFGDVEFDVREGNQPVYSFLIGVE
jgi:dihydroxyacetone kinase-like predicted kinase